MPAAGHDVTFSPANRAVALIAFTIGVEVAHQVLIVPLYFLLRPLRRSVAPAPAPADATDATDATAPTPDALPRGLISLRLASLLISLAGLVYLVQALRGA